MKYLIAISLLLFTVSGISQRDGKLKIEKNKEEVIDAIKEAHIPESAFWLGEENPENFRFVTDKLLIYNYWSPSCFECTPFLQELNQLEEKYPYVKVYHFLNPSDEKLYSNTEVYNLWRTIEKTRPIIIGTNDKLKSKIKSEGTPKAFMFSSRAVLKETQDDNYLAQFVDYLELLEKSGGANSLFSVSDMGHAKNSISEIALFNNPQSIVADELEGMLYVADTWNNRILGIDQLGEVSIAMGAGVQGFKDGSYGQATFNHPMGLALDSRNRILYVADTYNHSIRAINLNDRSVKTILGTGGKATILEKEIQRTESPINYPTKIQLIDGSLLISLESEDVMYKMDLTTKSAILLAGTGSRGSTDGKLESAKINAPISAVKLGANTLVLERNTGNIRSISKKRVDTFYSNSEADSLWLKRPSEIVNAGESIWIMDSENNMIKSIDATGEMRLVSGNKKGKKDGALTEAQFNSPVSACILDGNVYVLDALNNSIRIVNLETSTVSSMNIANAEEYFPFLRMDLAPKLDCSFPSRAGANLITVQLESRNRKVKENSIQLDLRQGIGEVVNLDQSNGIISIGSEVSEASSSLGIMEIEETVPEFTYFDITFLSYGKKDITDIRSHQYRVFIQYDLTEEEPTQKPLKLIY